jgi:hypothetical protein
MEDVVAEGGGSIPGWGFLRCERCFSSNSSKDFLVNGLGRTSSMPGIVLRINNHDVMGICLP